MISRRIVDIYKKVRFLRKKEGLNVKELAAELGLDEDFIANAEVNMQKLELNEVIRYCDYFGLHYETFLFDNFVKFRKDYLIDNEKMLKTIGYNV